MKILNLTVYKKWFDQIVSGEKKIEYRRNCPHWVNRFLFDEYDAVRFTNGYGKKRPSVLVKCLGIQFNTEENRYEIMLGEKIEESN